MKRFSRTLMILLGASIALMSTVSFAQSSATKAVTSTVDKIIRAAFQSSRPELSIGAIAASEIPGLYSVQVKDGPVLYSTVDGKYFVLGDLYQVGANGFINLAEKARESGRADVMAGISASDMIIFSPEKPAKAAIMVFTDVDCFYCQKLHKEIPDLNRLGIEVRYLAYPRAGIGSDSYKKIASAWCADDPREAMNKLKRRERIATNVCPENPVAEQFKLGGQVGVTGTPALVTSEGRLMPGYMPALRLANALGVDVDPVLAAVLTKKQALEK